MIRVGTAFFPTFQAAVAYYRPYGYDDVVATVERKLFEHEIHIGKPEVKDGQRLVLIDNGLRYAIEEN